MAACGLVCALLVAGLVTAATAPVTAPHRAAWKAEYRRPKSIPFPADDPYSKAKADLGRTLFFDPIMSGPGTLSCASCHNPALSWGDGLAKAVGVKGPLGVRAPTILDVAWTPLLGWDGKFRSLERLPLEGPVVSPTNMGRNADDLIADLSAISGYRKAFARAFSGDDKPTRKHVEMALATFERTVVAGEAPFDRWIDGDESAISESAKRGFDIFNGKGQCAECHSGWNFTDGSFHDVGTASGKDIGRARLFPTSTKLRFAFKVPTLRDVARRAPYMHKGSEPTLEAVVDLYNRGGIDRPSRAEFIKPLGLTAQDKADLIAFMKTLTGKPMSVQVPAVPR